jgi:hypothetical protein
MSDLEKLKKDIENLKNDIKGLKLYNFEIMKKIREICDAAHFFMYWPPHKWKNDPKLTGEYFSNFLLELRYLSYDFTELDFKDRIYNYYKPDRFDNQEIMNNYNTHFFYRVRRHIPKNDTNTYETYLSRFDPYNYMGPLQTRARERVKEMQQVKEQQAMSVILANIMKPKEGEGEGEGKETIQEIFGNPDILSNISSNLPTYLQTRKNGGKKIYKKKTLKKDRK